MKKPIWMTLIVLGAVFLSLLIWAICENKALELNIPKQCWSHLQKGETIEVEGKEITPNMVMGDPRKGLKVTYCTDSRPTDSIREYAAESDLFICEGMYGEPENQAKAKDKKHMTMQEAAQIAKMANVKELWLTHYSPSVTRPEEFVKEIRKIFPETIAAKDGRSVELKFAEE